MITDKQLDETLVELLRTKRALEALRSERKALREHEATQGKRCWPAPSVIHAAAKRASMDLSRALSKLRKGDV